MVCREGEGAASHLLYLQKKKCCALHAAENALKQGKSANSMMSEDDGAFFQGLAVDVPLESPQVQVGRTCVG